MEKLFHVFVRKHSGGGCSVGVLDRPEFTAFAATEHEARADLLITLQRLLSDDKHHLLPCRLHWPGMKLRRVDMVLRAMQYKRLLDVPMRFTLLTHPCFKGDDEEDEPDATTLTLRIPRLGISHQLQEPGDLIPFAQEVIRHHLHMKPLDVLLEAAYDGEESTDVLSVTYTERAAREQRRKGKQRKRPSRTTPPPTVSEAAHRLNDDVERDRLLQAFQMDHVLEQLASALKGRKASVLLVGPSGVGKTAVIHELVRRVESANADPDIKGLEVYSTSGARIMAGMRYLGQWQQRATQMISELRARNAVLHLGSLTELLNLESQSTGMSLAQLFTQAMENGDVTLVCEATAEDVGRAERQHPAFIHSFQRLVIPPLSGQVQWMALNQAVQRIAKHKKVSITNAAMTRASDLNERFGLGSAVLGGTIQLLVAATGMLIKGRSTVDDGEVIHAFCARTGYPRELVDPNVTLDPDAVLAHFTSRVVGQYEAMLLLRDLVVTLKTGLSDSSRPLGTFLLLGPTGVGKTESALALAEYLFGTEKRLCRFDMGEYSAPGSAARLVSTWGGTEGVLTRRVREQPFGIVLFDEVEKADTSVHDLLLQILGEARLSDGTGNTVSFRNIVVIMTSNLGADAVGRRLGFAGGDTAGIAQHYMAAAQSFFRPELLNRIDHVVPYRSLEPGSVQEIARKLIAKALEREGLTRRGSVVQHDPEVVQRVANLGFDPRYGARPLKRAVEAWVVAPVARLLAAAGANPPSHIHVSLQDGHILVAPPAVQSVLGLDAATLHQQLATHATLHHVTLELHAQQAHAVAHLHWLVDQYDHFVQRHGGTLHLHQQTDPLKQNIEVRGAMACLLVHECGVHAFTSHGNVQKVHLQRVDEPLRPCTRGYELHPSLVVDHDTGLEHVGSWEQAMGPDWLERFILCRAQLNPGKVQSGQA